MGWPRKLPGRRNPPPNGKRDKKCPKCGRKFGSYNIKEKRGGRLVKVCPYCGAESP